MPLRSTMLLIGLLLAPCVAAAELGVSVRETGAVPDGKTPCTGAVQKAIDRCHASGGGTVVFPPGRWLSGTLFLKDNVTLRLEAGATLLGSTNLKDYPVTISKVRSRTDGYVKRVLITGEGLRNVAIRGRGTIDGQGGAFLGKPHFERPFIIRLVKCRDVLVEDVFLRNSPMWMQHYLACDRVTLRGVRVFNHINRNNDGLDIDSCRDVLISGCNFDAEDDALCLKATTLRSCENVAIANCVLSSHAIALKLGTETNGGCKNLSVTNCVICSPRYSKVLMSSGEQRGRTGITLIIADGGTLDGVTISNVTIDGVLAPFFLRLSDRAQPYTEGAPAQPVGTFRNVILNNIVATNVSNHGCAIFGTPGHRIENVTLSNVQMEFAGGGTEEDARRTLPEMEKGYPKITVYGTIMPAYGLACRHVKGLRLVNVQMATKKPDARPALRLDDVEDVVTVGMEREETR